MFGRKNRDYGAEDEIIELDETPKKVKRKSKKKAKTVEEELNKDYGTIIDINSDDALDLDSEEDEFEEIEYDDDDYIIDMDANSSLSIDDFFIDLSDENGVVIMATLLNIKAKFLTGVSRLSSIILFLIEKYQTRDKKESIKNKVIRYKKELEIIISDRKKAVSEKKKVEAEKTVNKSKDIRKVKEKKKKTTKLQLDISHTESKHDYIGINAVYGFNIGIGESSIGYIEFAKGDSKDLWLSSYEIDTKYNRFGSKILKSFISNFSKNPAIDILCIESKLNLDNYTKSLNPSILNIDNHRVCAFNFKNKSVEELKYLELKEEEFDDYEDFVEEDVVNDFEEQGLRQDLKLFDITKKTYNYGRLVTVGVLVAAIIICSVNVAQKNQDILSNLQQEFTTSKERGSMAWINNFLGKRYEDCDKLLAKKSNKYKILTANSEVETGYRAIVDSLIDNIKTYKVSYDETTGVYTLNIKMYCAKQIDSINLDKESKSKLLSIRKDYINSTSDKSQFQKDLADFYLDILKSKVLVYDTTTEVSLSFEIKQETDNHGVVYVSNTDNIVNQMIDAVDIKNNISCYEENITEKVNKVLKDGK